MLVRKPAFIAAVLLFVCVVLPPRSGLAREARTVQSYLAEAMRLYDLLEFEQALEQLAQGRTASTGRDDDASLSLHEGLILAELGRSEASDAAFEAALERQPDAVFPTVVSPKVQQRFEKVRQQVKARLTLRPSQPATHPSSSLQQDSVAASAVEPSQSSVRVWLPASIGGGLLVGSGVTYLLARGQEAKLKGTGSDFATPADVKRTTSRGQTYQRISLGLAGAGVAALGVSAGLYLMARPSKAQRLALSVGSDGTSAYLFGRWP